MSRSNYSDDLDALDLGRWRGQVASAIRGKRGQRLLRDLLEALDAMPDKSLIAHELESDGEVCALGCVGLKRGIDMSDIDPEEPDDVAAAFDIAEQLAREIAHINDEWGPQNESCEARWARVRAWTVKQIRPDSGKSEVQK